VAFFWETAKAAIGFKSADTTEGTFIALQLSLRSFLGTFGTCLAATWLYFFIKRQLREKPGWLTGEPSVIS